jgi:hypothetical protein
LTNVDPYVILTERSERDTRCKGSESLLRPETPPAEPVRENSPANFFVFGKSAGISSSVPQATRMTLSRTQSSTAAMAKIISQGREKGIDKAGWR